MKYSESLVWEAVYTFLPSIKIARNRGVSLNLSSLVKVAAVEAFVSDVDAYSEKYLYAEILRKTIKEMNYVGHMTFGDQSEL